MTKPRLLQIIQHLAQHHGISGRELGRRSHINHDTACKILRADEWRGLESIESALSALVTSETWDSICRDITAAGMAE